MVRLRSHKALRHKGKLPSPPAPLPFQELALLAFVRIVGEGSIIGCLIILFLGLPLFGDSVYDHLKITEGILKKNEIWQGKVLLTGDVLVPKNLSLTLEPDIWLIYNDFDQTNLGKYEDRCELIVKGKLIRKGNKNSVSVLSIHDPKVQAFLKPFSQQVVTIVPEKADLKPVQDEWRGFSGQYALVWALMYSLILVF